MYRMIDSEYSTDNYKYLKISIGEIIKKLEKLRLDSDHLKIKKMCNHAVKKLSFVIRDFPEQCRTQQMCDRELFQNDGTLESIPN